MARLSRAGLYAAQGRTGEALADLTAVDGVDDPGVSLLRAEIHTARDEHDQAIACLTAALRHAPDDPRLLNNLAHLLATSPREDLRDPALAVETARKACTLDETASRLDTLAAALAAAGQWDEAIRTQEKAMEDAPERRPRGDARAVARVHRGPSDGVGVVSEPSSDPAPVPLAPCTQGERGRG